MENFEEILIDIDILMLKGNTDAALKLFTTFLIKYTPNDSIEDCDIFINILSLTYVWPEYKDDTNIIIIRTLAQRRIANSKHALVYF